MHAWDERAGGQEAMRNLADLILVAAKPNLDLFRQVKMADDISSQDHTDNVRGRGIIVDMKGYVRISYLHAWLSRLLFHGQPTCTIYEHDCWLIGAIGIFHGQCRDTMTMTTTGLLHYPEPGSGSGLIGPLYWT
jgi:hypothetical protein